MIPVYQSIVCNGRGDCMRAVMASMFHLELEAVPHFFLHGDNWFNSFWHFLLSVGYEYVGAGYAEHLEETEPVNGCYYISVKSKTFNNTSHAVLIDKSGMVIHDPNPNKAWLGINVLQTGEIECLYRIEKKTS